MVALFDGARLVEGTIVRSERRSGDVVGIADVRVLVNDGLGKHR